MNGAELKRTLNLHGRLDRLWADERFDRARCGADIRLLAEAILWAWHRRIPAADRTAWILSHTGHRTMPGLLHNVVAADVPRYEPPDSRYATPCAAALERGPRRGQPCGGPPRSGVRVTDPATGRWANVGYCHGHRLHAEAAQAAELIRTGAGGIPEPAPNAGGLLPCHVRQDWTSRYRAARPSWTLPAAGVCADDWPALAQVAAAAAPKLVLLAGGGTSAGDADADGVPGLALVPARGPGR